MHLLLMIGLVVFSILAVLIRDLLKAAISLAVASIFLALIFFRMNAVLCRRFRSLGGRRADHRPVHHRHRPDPQRRTRWPRANYHLFVFPLFFLALAVIDILVMKKLLGQIPAITRRRSRDFRRRAVERAHAST